MKKSEQKIKINGVWEETFPISRSALIYRPDNSTVEQALSDIEANKLSTTPNGTDPLIHEGKITPNYFPDVILGQMQYGGTFNMYDIISSSPYSNLLNKSLIGIDVSEISGFYFIYEGTNEFHTFDSKEFGIGDWLVCNGNITPHWTRIKNTDAVTSVNGQTGAVVLPPSNFTWTAETQSLSSVEGNSVTLLRNQLHPANKTPNIDDTVLCFTGTDSDGATGVYLVLATIIEKTDIGYIVQTKSSKYIRGQKGINTAAIVPNGQDANGGNIYNVMGDNGVILGSIVAPKGNKGDTGATGPQGEPGPTGATPTISCRAGSNIGVVGTPSVTLENGTTFVFRYLKGEKGDTGATGPNIPIYCHYCTLAKSSGYPAVYINFELVSLVSNGIAAATFNGIFGGSITSNTSIPATGKIITAENTYYDVVGLSIITGGNIKIYYISLSSRGYTKSYVEVPFSSLTVYDGVVQIW